MFDASIRSTRGKNYVLTSLNSCSDPTPKNNVLPSAFENTSYISKSFMERPDEREYLTRPHEISSQFSMMEDRHYQRLADQEEELDLARANEIYEIKQAHEKLKNRSSRVEKALRRRKNTLSKNKDN